VTVVALDQINKSEIDLAGGKGANLGELIANGFPVPPGFVIGADEYASFITAFDIPSNDTMPEDPEEFLAGLRERILETPLCRELQEKITAAHEELKMARPSEFVYAIRSSATAEDLADASFAGQHDTYYYVAPIDLEVMTRKCWASLWSDAAFSYRQSQGIEHRSVNMAVVAQEMVRSDVSGVTFTADPVSGSESVIITEASWGMGAAIVDGRVSPDQYLVDKISNRLTSIKISDKKFMVPATLSEGQTSRLTEVPADIRNKEALTDDQVEKIAQLALKAEQHFGGAQDIEWAIHGGDLFFLQSRPITVIGEHESEVPPGRYILFKPLAENFTDPLLPLTLDMLDDYVPLTIIHGRAYIRFELIRGLIPLKISDEDVARLGYLSDPEETNLRLSIPRLLLLSTLLISNYLLMAVFNRRTAAMPDDFMASYRAFCNRIAEDDSVSAQDTLVSVFGKFRFFEPAGNMVLLVNLVAPRYMLFLKMLSGLIEKWCPALPPDTASLLCSGTEGVLSTEMGREILELAEIAREFDDVAQIIREVPLKQTLSTLRTIDAAGNFINHLDRFLAKHGHRALKEFELNSVRWEEDPTQVLGMVRNYLLVDSDLNNTEADIQAQRNELEHQVDQALLAMPLESLGRPRLGLIRFLVGQTRYYMKLRENSRFYHIMGFYAVRKKLLKIEQSLLEANILKCKDDIFYLQWHEVKGLQSGELGWQDVEDTIRSRRMEYIRLSKFMPPKTIGIDIEAAQYDAGSTSLSGQGASPGRYEGIAKVIMDPATDNEIEPGEILVAPYTDPAWTPLFLTANAAVIEVGSYLSHAGTIAREYGMPCVVDVTNCTSRITTGTRIIVDGTQGSVVIVEEKA
jgi:rifampicin phosphotransferase